jgi:hypothetical protein
MNERLKLEKIVIGHNQFFGVNHLSASKGATTSAYFSDVQNVLKLVRVAYDNGAKGMMMSTHERAIPITEMILSNSELSKEIVLYPLLPYVQKYVVAANEKGMINVVFDALSGTKLSSKMKLILNGGKGIISNDINSILSTMISLELKPFEKLRVGAVFLHDVFTDLALALGLRDVFEFYQEEIHSAYRARGAFATKNLPYLLERFSEWGFSNPIVMTHFNKNGFQMNPSREACESSLFQHKVSVMAMGTLASGYLKPDEAYQYLSGIPNIESVVVGTSSEVHARETFSAIKKYGLG